MTKLKLKNSLRVRIVELSILFVCLLINASVAAAEKMKLIEFWNDSEPASLIDLDHSPFAEILQKYVVSDHPSGIARFNYAAMTEGDFAKLEQYLEYLQLMEPRQLNEAEAKAYWINLYNAATLRMFIQAVANGNFNRIRERGLPARRWRQDVVTIAQQEMSLEDILHGVIRPMYQDRRIHYALFFCTLGGPDVPVDVLNGENNEELLASFEKKYLQHSRAVRIESGDLVLSEMFKSYDTDFAPNRRDLIEYLKQHVPESVAQVISGANEIRYEYDTRMNAL